MLKGAVAQLGEHLLCKQGVVGSIPISSTIDGISGQGSAEDRAKRWHRASVSLWFLTRSYRLFFNNVEEVKVLLLPGRSWREPRFVRVERDWVGLYRPVLALVGWGWGAQAPVMRSEVLSVMGSSD